MTRKWPASTVDRALAGSYFEKAIRFRADAEKMMELADEFSGNGISVLCVMQRSRTQMPLPYSRRGESPRAEIIATPRRSWLPWFQSGAPKTKRQ
jgi:hypothetical protein